MSAGFKLSFRVIALLTCWPLCIEGWGANAQSGDVIINVDWGLRPETGGTSPLSNDTKFYRIEGNEEVRWLVGDFTNSWRAALLWIGDGSWSAGKGWNRTRWLFFDPPAFDGWSSRDPTKTKYLQLDGNNALPLSQWGRWESDPLGEASGIDEHDYYTNIWESQFAVNLLRNIETGAVYGYSETPGGDEIAGLGSMKIVESLVFSGSGGRIFNVANLIVSTPSQRVYVGGEIPPYCIWKADYELTQEYLATLPQGQVEAAFGLRKHPTDPYCVWMNKFDLTLADLETLRPELVALAFACGVSPSDPFCVWMVDWDLTQEDLDSLDADYVDFAVANRMDPRDDHCRWMYDFQLTAEYLATLPAAQVREAFERRVHPEDASFLRVFHATVFMMR